MVLCRMLKLGQKGCGVVLGGLHARLVSTGPAAYTQPLFYTNGRRHKPVNPNNADDYHVTEPHTGRWLCEVRGSSQEDVNKAVNAAKEALPRWSSLSGGDRSRILYKAGQIIREHAEALAIAEVHDTGKPLWEARFDIDGCADTVEYCAAITRTIAGQYIDLGNGGFGYTRREPLGVIGAIGAWNFPFQMASWKSASALCCGNTVVYKPSPLTPLTTVMLAEIYSEAGVPDGVFNVIQGQGEAGAWLSEHPDIAKMTFTGSVNTGSKVMQTCAKGIKDILLELGGKSPVLIFDDCDLENAIKGTMLANFLTQGQVCSNGTRVFVQRSIYDTFVDKLVARVEGIKLGDPFNEDTTMGAIISADQADRILAYINSAKQQGAKVLCGGIRASLEGDLAGGHYIRPTVLVDVKDTMAAVREEIFGPVVCVLPFDSEDEAVRRANDTDFGLAGGVFTKDMQRAHRVAAALQAGSIYINNYNIYPNELPFGGYKKSGIGRENSILNIEEFTQVKSVYVEMGDVDSPI